MNNFFSISFSKLFLEKHGSTIYDDIILQIKNEKLENCSENYIEAIFRVAFLGYFGLDENALNNMLKDIGCKEDIKNISKTHKKSIEVIIKYIIKTNKNFNSFCI